MASKAQQLIYPGESAWLAVQPGESPSDANAREVPLPLRLESNSPTVIALPADYLSAVPLFIPNTSAAQSAGMLELQLEKKGLISQYKTKPAIAFEKFDEGGNADAYLTVVLDPDVPDEICVEKAESYEAAPRLFQFPENRVTIYRELGYLVAAIDIHGKLVYFQKTGAEVVEDGLASEVQLMLSGLASDIDLSALTGITLWVECPQEAQQELADTLALPVEQIQPPPPRLPADSWNIVPPKVLALRAGTRALKRTRKLTAALVAVILATAAGLAAHVTVLSLEASRLQADIASDADEVEQIRQTSRRWRTIELAINPDIYPLERLYQTSRLLPEEGVRLTVFEQRGANLVIAGEASSTPAAIKFTNDLKRSPGWAGYECEIPQPKILANNSAQFRITARRVVPVGPPVENP